MTPRSRPTRRQVLTAATTACAGLALAACGGAGSKPSAGSATRAGAPATSPTVPVKIGYFPNITHAPGLVADAEGFLSERIGAGKVTTQSFNAGPDVIQALFSGSLDIAYLGPNPTATAYTQSQGAAVRVIAGAASGGAALVVKPSITVPEQLRGARLATPQLGNSQDVALRYWLSTKGFRTTTEGGGDIKIQPLKNATALQSYVSGQLDGAWVPEPYASLFLARGARVLVDERTLWPEGTFATTGVVVRTRFLSEHPETVRAFLEAHLDALDLIAEDPARAQQDVISQVGKLTDQTLQADTVVAAWKTLTFTADPLATALKQSADHAAAVGLLPDRPGDGFARLWALNVLNAALKARGEPEVTS
jgi:NitT/TauT family transport system substrate-binding protein